MAKVYCTGPAHLFVGVGDLVNKTPLYLGTAESAPQISWRREYELVMNDLGGARLPLDRTAQGEEATISAVLTRWNESVFSRLMSVPVYTATRGQESTQPGDDLGTVMGQEGFTFPVWITFPYAVSHAAFVGDMPPGYRFWSCINMADAIMPGTRAKKHQVMFQATRAWTAKSAPVGSLTESGGGALLARMVLYDNDMSGLPDIN